MKARIVLFFCLVAICANIDAQVCFEPVQSFSSQVNGDVVEKGDFNNDGKIDLVIGNSTRNGNFIYDIYFLTGNANGEFDTVYNVESLDKPTKILFGDFNNDKNQDIAVGFVRPKSNWNDYGITVYWGYGNGVFDSVTTEVGTSIDRIDFCTADFNRDGAIDLAIAYFTPRKIMFFHGSKDSSFMNNETISSPIFRNLSTINCADLNSDGWYDLVIGNGAQKGVLVDGNDSLSVLIFNKLDSSFYPAENSWCKGRNQGIYFGDFDGDHNIDILSTNYFKAGTGNSVILWGKGGARFEVADNLISTNYIKATVNDFNQDGKDDIAFIKDTITTQNLLWVVTGTIDRKMGMEQSFPISNGNLFSGDLNTDSLADIYTLTSTLNVLFNCSATGFNEIDSQLKIKYYPNPCHSFLKIESEGDSKINYVEIYDISGRLLDKHQFSPSGELQIKMEVAGGVYFFRCKSENNRVTNFKVIRD
jgi:hypothetical protein